MKYLKLALLMLTISPMIQAIIPPRCQGPDCPVPAERPTPPQPSHSRDGGYTSTPNLNSIARVLNIYNSENVIFLAKLMAQRQNITVQQALNLLPQSNVRDGGFGWRPVSIPNNFSAGQSFNLGYFTNSKYKSVSLKQPLSIYYGFAVGGQNKPKNTNKILNNKIVFVTPGTHLMFNSSQYTVITVPNGPNLKLTDFDIIDANQQAAYLPSAGILEDNYLSLLCDYTAIVLDLSQDSKGTLVLGQAWTLWDPIS
jgi:hypothetical protein